MTEDAINQPVAEIRGIYYWKGNGPQYRPVGVPVTFITPDTLWYQYQAIELPEGMALKSSAVDLWPRVFVAVRFNQLPDGTTSAILGKTAKIKIVCDNGHKLDAINQNMRVVEEVTDYPGSKATILFPFELPKSDAMEGGELWVAPSGRAPGVKLLDVTVSMADGSMNPTNAKYFIKIVEG